MKAAALEVKVGQRWRDSTPEHVARCRETGTPRRVLEIDDIDEADGVALAHNVDTQQVSVLPLARFVAKLDYRGSRVVELARADFDLVA